MILMPLSTLLRWFSAMLMLPSPCFIDFDFSDISPLMIIDAHFGADIIFAIFFAISIRLHFSPPHAIISYFVFHDAFRYALVSIAPFAMMIFCRHAAAAASLIRWCLLRWYFFSMISLYCLPFHVDAAARCLRWYWCRFDAIIWYYYFLMLIPLLRHCRHADYATLIFFWCFDAHLPDMLFIFHAHFCRRLLRHILIIARWWCLLPRSDDGATLLKIFIRCWCPLPPLMPPDHYAFRYYSIIIFSMPFIIFVAIISLMPAISMPFSFFFIIIFIFDIIMPFFLSFLAFHAIFRWCWCSCCHDFRWYRHFRCLSDVDILLFFIFFFSFWYAIFHADIIIISLIIDFFFRWLLIFDILLITPFADYAIIAFLPYFLLISHIIFHAWLFHAYFDITFPDIWCYADAMPDAIIHARFTFHCYFSFFSRCLILIIWCDIWWCFFRCLLLMMPWFWYFALIWRYALLIFADIDIIILIIIIDAAWYAIISAYLLLMRYFSDADFSCWLIILIFFIHFRYWYYSSSITDIRLLITFFFYFPPLFSLFSPLISFSLLILLSPFLFWCHFRYFFDAAAAILPFRHVSLLLIDSSLSLMLYADAWLFFFLLITLRYFHADAFMMPRWLLICHFARWCRCFSLILCRYFAAAAIWLIISYSAILPPPFHCHFSYDAASMIIVFRWLRHWYFLMLSLDIIFLMLLPPLLILIIYAICIFCWLYFVCCCWCWWFIDAYWCARLILFHIFLSICFCWCLILLLMMFFCWCCLHYDVVLLILMLPWFYFATFFAIYYDIFIRFSRWCRFSRDILLSAVSLPPLFFRYAIIIFMPFFTPYWCRLATRLMLSLYFFFAMPTLLSMPLRWYVSILLRHSLFFVYYFFWWLLFCFHWLFSFSFIIHFDAAITLFFLLFSILPFFRSSFHYSFFFFFHYFAYFHYFRCHFLQLMLFFIIFRRWLIITPRHLIVFDFAAISIISIRAFTRADIMPDAARLMLLLLRYYSRFDVYYFPCLHAIIFDADILFRAFDAALTLFFAYRHTFRRATPIIYYAMFLLLMLMRATRAARNAMLPPSPARYFSAPVFYACTA